MPDPKTGALPLGYAPMLISETDRKRPKAPLSVPRGIHPAK